MARYNEIIHLMDDEPGAFEPILYEAPNGSMLAADWAEGFMDAFGLRVDAWDALFEDEESRLLSECRRAGIGLFLETVSLSSFRS